MKGIYARVSTEEQAKHGYSLQDQLRECRKKAGTNDLIEYVDEGISGEVLERPELTRLRKDIREGIITEVICLDPDRLSRKLGNQIIIADEIEKRAKLLFVNGEYAKTPEGILFFQLRGAISEFEKAKITERMSRGRREKARQGKVVRDYQIYGYDYDSENRKLIINEREAEIVRLIFKLFAETEKKVRGINGIAHYLTSQKIPTKRNSSIWHRQVVRQILKNKVYIGEFYQNRWNTEGMLYNKFKSKDERIQVKERPKEEQILIPCPAIIDNLMFLKAQNILEESRRRWAGTGKNKYLLSGLVRCGECGNTMTGRNSKNWGKYVFEYVDYKNTAGAKNRGCGKRVKVLILDEIVWNTMVSWLNQPAEIAEEIKKKQTDNQVSFKKAEKQRIEQKLQELNSARVNLINFIAFGSEDLGEAGKHETLLKIKEIKNKEARLVKQLHDLEQLDNVEEQHDIKQYLLQEALEYYFTKASNELTFENKQELIRCVVKEVRIYDDEIKIIGF